MTDEQLKEIENFAYVYLSIDEICLVMGIEDKAIFKDEADPVYSAFWKGRIKRKADYNNSIIKLSDQLSSPAQAIEAKLALNTHLNDKK